ncbi:MAG: hypothetical protein ABIJ31_16905 [Pseudomonadota bacterium]
MKNYPRCVQNLLIAMIVVSIWGGFPTSSFAGISEPEHILYGVVSTKDTIYPTGKILLKLNGTTLAETQIKESGGTHRYILRIPMDGTGPRNLMACRSGDIVDVFFNSKGYLLGKITIGDKGKAAQMDFNIPDSDNDGLSDADELDAQTKKDNPDSDGDKLLDGWEKLYGFDPVGTDESGQDTDMDGLSNLQEQASGTHPKNDDTDGDDCKDGIELAGRRNPLVADPYGDINQDCQINMKDIHLSLEIMSEISDSLQARDMPSADGEIIRSAEVIFALQKMADLRGVKSN